MRTSALGTIGRGAFLALALLAAATVRAGAASPVTVSDAWSPPATGTALVYATITNAGDEADRLIGASSPGAAVAELHDSLHGTAPVPAIVIPAHGTVTLAPGGRYLSLLGLKTASQAGGLILARVQFERAGWLVVVVRVGAAP